MTYHRQPSPRRNANSQGGEGAVSCHRRTNPTNGPHPGLDAIIEGTTMVRNTTQAKSAVPAETSSTDHAGTTRGRPDKTRPEDQTRTRTEQAEHRAAPAAAMPMRRHPKDLMSLRIDHDVRNVRYRALSVLSVTIASAVRTIFARGQDRG